MDRTSTLKLLTPSTVLYLLLTLWSAGAVQLSPRPHSHVPEVYNIHLEPNFMNNTLKGNLTVDFYSKRDGKLIYMDRNNINVTNITVGNIGVLQWTNNPVGLDIELDQSVEPNKTYSMNILYEAVIDTSEYGFYRSNYTDGTETKWIALTHFKLTGARRAFPCWDDPDYKAYFHISITHPKNYTAVLSNTPVIKQTDNGETVTTYFDRTNRMATYTLSFTLTDYAYKLHTDDRIRVYTKPNSVNYTDYAWNFAERALKAMDEYTGIPYFSFMPKIDLVATKSSDDRTMENWDLVTYREDMLLYKEGVTTTAQKEEISKTIARKIAQQWFGNLVSVQKRQRWYIWLHEGMADFVAMYVLDKLEPTWRVMDMLAVGTIQKGVFDKGIHRNRHYKPGNELFWRNEMPVIHGPPYVKGSGIIRMFAQLLSDEIVHKALKAYLEEHKFDVANPTELLDHLNKSLGTERTFAGRSFQEVANDWVEQLGFPVVIVMRIQPGRYLLARLTPDSACETEQSTWRIPITYTTNNKLDFTDTNVTHWLTEDKLIIDEPGSDWIIVNKQRRGYYRVIYIGDIWQDMVNFLTCDDLRKIHPINRAQLIDDVFASVRNHFSNHQYALFLATYLNLETDYLPWMAAFRNMDIVHDLIQTDETFKDVMKSILHGLITKVTYEASPNDDHTTKILRAQAMHWACLAEVEECLASAQKHFNAWLNDPHYKIDPDLRDTIICTGLRTASQEVADKARKILENEPVSTDCKKRRRSSEVWNEPVEWRHLRRKHRNRRLRCNVIF